MENSAVRELRALPREVVPQIACAVAALSANPYPHGVKKLSGAEHTFRIRQGSYRVVYKIMKSTAVVEIIKIGHRREVYGR